MARLSFSRTTTAMEGPRSVSLFRSVRGFREREMGQLIGGVFATTLLGLLFGLAFKSKEPDSRALSATMCAWVCASVLAGFGMADGRSFRFDAALIYLPGAIGTFFFLRWH